MRLLCFECAVIGSSFDPRSMTPNIRRYTTAAASTTVTIVLSGVPRAMKSTRSPRMVLPMPEMLPLSKSADTRTTMHTPRYQCRRSPNSRIRPSPMMMPSANEIPARFGWLLRPIARPLPPMLAAEPPVVEAWNRKMCSVVWQMATKAESAAPNTKKPIARCSCSLVASCWRHRYCRRKKTYRPLNTTMTESSTESAWVLARMPARSQMNAPMYQAGVRGARGGGRRLKVRKMKPVRKMASLTFKPFVALKCNRGRKNIPTYTQPREMNVKRSSRAAACLHFAHSPATRTAHKTTWRPECPNEQLDLRPPTRRKNPPRG